MIGFFKSLTTLGRLIVVGAVAIVLIVAFFSVRAWFIGDSKIEARVATEQAGAAIESGQDAVETVGQNQDKAHETEGKVEGVQNNVNAANDTDTADRAGRDGLCVQFGVCD